MTESRLLETIRHNCDISDARDNGIYSICNLVLKLRNLYKWEHAMGDGASGRYGVYRVMGYEAAPDGKLVAGRAAPDQPLAGSGDAWVLLVHFARPVKAWSVLAYGQTTKATSPHSHDQIALFARHELRPVWYRTDEIEAHLERAYRP